MKRDLDDDTLDTLRESSSWIHGVFQTDKDRVESILTSYDSVSEWPSRNKGECEGLREYI